MIYYAGTEYIQGIRKNVSKLLTGKMRMFTAPKHPYQHVDTISDWACNEIRYGISQYEIDWMWVDV